jgi:hypothetical protein
MTSLHFLSSLIGQILILKSKVMMELSLCLTLLRSSQNKMCGTYCVDYTLDDYCGSIRWKSIGIVNCSSILEPNQCSWQSIERCRRYSYDSTIVLFALPFLTRAVLRLVFASWNTHPHQNIALTKAMLIDIVSMKNETGLVGFAYLITHAFMSCLIAVP